MPSSEEAEPDDREHQGAARCARDASPTSSRLSSSEPPSACSGVTLSTRREPTQDAIQVVRMTPTSGRISTGSQYP